MPKITSSKILTFFLIILLIGLSYSIIAVIPEAVVSYENISSLQKSIAEKERQKNTLAITEPHTNSDDFLEQEAKRKLNYKQSDEKVIIFKDEEVKSPFNGQVPVATKKEDASIFARIYNIVIEIFFKKQS